MKNHDNLCQNTFNDILIFENHKNVIILKLKKL